MSMGDRLRQLRLERHLSQEEVARQVGITRSAYSHYEINNRHPVYDTLIKLAQYFNVSLDYIIGGGGTKRIEHPPETQEYKILELFKSMDQEQRQLSIGLLLGIVEGERTKSVRSGVAKSK
ncbi:helix-turn-helix domain-containing protein [Cohnella sp. JJ-181]|uniref:helix-turn-helix domain-containing protein n=1 Tax=Cohnella rhizoplanae TaxID=2974897 RepID=UPI0022FF9756|nr:helix-turn-helix transcriptional regulator [Cohnella sp. JJ-181]CAI6081166.1 HTH-type transcriptional regulator Xre [Cohnella sp. JJ-181]